MNMSLMRIPPHSVEAEQSVIGSVLVRNSALDDLALDPQQFYGSQHKLLWQTLLDMREDGEVMDVLTVSDRLRINDSLDRAGGFEYLHSIADRVPSAANAQHYAKIVRETAAQRALIASLQDACDDAWAPSADPAAVLDRAQEAVMQISLDEPAEVAGIGPALEEFEAVLRKRSRGEEVQLKTGLHDLDRILGGGLRAGDLIVVGGRPSMGKSSLAMQWADYAAVNLGKSALIFSMEMSRVQCVNRTVARVGDIPLPDLLSGVAYGRPIVADVMARLRRAHMEIDARPALNVRQIRHKARDVKRKVGLNLIVIDYLQLMDGDGDDRRLQIEDISRSLKALAKELHVPVVVLSQLSRKCEERMDKRPMNSDLRESGAIEQDADVIVFVYREEVYHPDREEWHGVAELLVTKQRDGEIGTVNARYFGSRTHFRSLDGPLPSRNTGGRGRSKGMD